MELMVVEDEQYIREGILYLLAGLSPALEVTAVGDGMEAWECIVRTGRMPDVLITDIRMPGLDGLQLIQRVRSHSMAAKVIFISGYEDFAYAQQAIRLGAIGYVTKPIDQEELMHLVQAAMDAIQREDRVGHELELRQSRRESPEQQIQDVLMHMERAPGEVSLKSLSERWNCSPAHVSHLFKELTGYNFKDHLLECRMKCAKELLLQGGSPAEICEALGYSDYDYFSKAFKRYYGESPAEYKRRHTL